jgi:hypothetical protein
MEGCILGQVLHGCATTTEAVRRAIQHSQKSLSALAKHYGQKTVAKRRKRSSIADLPTASKEPKSTVLSVEDEAIIVVFRRYTLLPLDDCLYALQATLPHLTRSSLHRCLQRHGISRLPEVEGDKPDKRKFKTYPIGYFHVDIAEVRTEEGRLYLFVAIDRTSKFAFVELHEKATMRGATDFLQALIKAVPYKSIPCLPTTAFSSLTWRRMIAAAKGRMRWSWSISAIYRSRLRPAVFRMLPSRVVAKAEWQPGELYPRVGFIVTNLSRPVERVVAFYNKRGTCEQWIKEGKTAIKWTRLSCCSFAANAVRLHLHTMAYNLANFMRTLALPEAVAQWSLTSCGRSW